MIRIPPSHGFEFGIESEEQRKRREEIAKQEALENAELSPEELAAREEKEKSRKGDAEPKEIYEAKGNKGLFLKMKRSPVNRNREIK